MLATLLCVAPALAQTSARVPLEIDAPKALRELLDRHLDLTSSAGEADDAEQVRLLRSLRKQTTDLLATEGYFSPDIEVSG